MGHTQGNLKLSRKFCFHNNVEGTSNPTLSLVVPMYNKLLDLLEEVSRDATKQTLIRKGAKAGLDKFLSYYDKSPPLIMSNTFMDPRCRMNYFIANGSKPPRP